MYLLVAKGGVSCSMYVFRKIRIKTLLLLMGKGAFYLFEMNSLNAIKWFTKVLQQL